MRLLCGRSSYLQLGRAGCLGLDAGTVRNRPRGNPLWFESQRHACPGSAYGTDWQLSPSTSQAAPCPKAFTDSPSIDRPGSVCCDLNLTNSRPQFGQTSTIRWSNNQVSIRADEDRHHCNEDCLSIPVGDFAATRSMFYLSSPACVQARYAGPVHPTSSSSVSGRADARKDQRQRATVTERCVGGQQYNGLSGKLTERRMRTRDVETCGLDDIWRSWRSSANRTCISWILTIIHCLSSGIPCTFPNSVSMRFGVLATLPACQDLTSHGCQPECQS